MNDCQVKPLERHNASADEQVIEHGGCGQKHLATGRGCVRRAGHEGPCDFGSPQDVRAIADGLVPPRP